MKCPALKATGNSRTTFEKQLVITSMLRHGKDVAFQMIKFSYTTMGQDLQDLFFYQKLQDLLITKLFKIITVWKGCYKTDSNIAEKEKQAKEKGRFNGQRADFLHSNQYCPDKTQLKEKLQCLKTFSQQSV